MRISARLHSLSARAPVAWAGALFLLGIALPATAADVMRWKDKDGVVHYGDPNAAPKNSAPVTIRSGGAGAASAGAKDAPPPPPQAFAGFSAEKIGHCAGLARAVINNDPGITPGGNGDTRMPGRQMNNNCPGVSFKCYTYYGHPEKNHCEPFKGADQGNVQNMMYDFPDKK